MASARPNTFLLRNKEKADFNQYWCDCVQTLGRNTQRRENEYTKTGHYVTHQRIPTARYSQPTIAAFVDAVQEQAGAAGRCAFLSTPSIFFSLDSDAVKQNSVLFDVCAHVLTTSRHAHTSLS